MKKKSLKSDTFLLKDGSTSLQLESSLKLFAPKCLWSEKKLFKFKEKVRIIIVIIGDWPHLQKYLKRSKTIKEQYLTWNTQQW